jgi:hypothetical protein
MSDELDALRSFRPEATGPTDALQLEERIAFMNTLARVPAGRRGRMLRLRPRRRILLGVAVALVAAVGTAGASGIIPDDVQQALGLAAAHNVNASLTPQIDQAVERASASTADGGTVQLWTAPTNGGGTCAYVRHLDAAGAPTDSGPISCAVSLSGGGRMGEVVGRAGSRSSGTMMSSEGSVGGASMSTQVDGTGAATLFGQAPGDVAKVEVVDSAGAVLGEAAATNGWFVLTLPAGTASTMTSLVAQSASGASISTVAIAVPPTPGTASAGSDGTTQSASGTTPS